MLDNILKSKLYRPGSVAYVSRSGGMSNELNNIVSINTNGVYEGVAIGGNYNNNNNYSYNYCFIVVIIVTFLFISSLILLIQ